MAHGLFNGKEFNQNCIQTCLNDFNKCNSSKYIIMESEIKCSHALIVQHVKRMPMIL